MQIAFSEYVEIKFYLQHTFHYLFCETLKGKPSQA